MCDILDLRNRNIWIEWVYYEKRVQFYAVIIKSIHKQQAEVNRLQHGI